MKEDLVMPQRNYRLCF